MLSIFDKTDNLSLVSHLNVGFYEDALRELNVFGLNYDNKHVNPGTSLQITDKYSF